jgi:hypothetical protein
MASGSFTTRVRPIRIAFLVDPTEPDALYRAIELNTSLWGGCYNPIIPAFGRTPKSWDSGYKKTTPKPAEIISGYLDGFDPDFVVPLGKSTKRNHVIGNRILLQENELVESSENAFRMSYGVGFLEVLQDIITSEFKYKRDDDLHIAIPKYSRTHRVFLASIFGAIPPQIHEALNKHYSDISGIRNIEPDLVNFVDLLQPNCIFSRRVSQWSIAHAPLRQPTIFLCDIKSQLDIIDYWNLRAAGYYVIPIPIQRSGNINVKQFVIDFIDKNYRPYKHNPAMFYQTTVQVSRSVSADVAMAFCTSLNVPGAVPATSMKYALRSWYPRFWDAWTREHTDENVAFPYSHEIEQRLTSDDLLELRAINPKFRLGRHFSGKAKFANEFRFRFYTPKEPMAEVIPEGSKELSSALGRYGYHNWRFSKSGPVFLADSEDDLIFLELPRAESVMIEWFREYGWTVSLSGPGRIATQLIKQLGGSFGTSWLAHKGVIKLLAELEKEAGLPRPAVLDKLKQVIADDGLHFDSDRFLEALIDTNAIKLGSKIQCPMCTRHNWFELNQLDYELVCRFCLSNFKAPQKTPKHIEWTYRAHGPFASSTAQGSFTVLLTYKFLTGHHDRAVTPLFSYTATKNGKLLEADLTCLYKKSTWGDTPMQVIHAECKSFNRFQQRDVDRMTELADAFPNSTLIFATLNESLDEAEMKIIRLMAESERKKRFRNAAYSPLIILTGIELFSSRGYGINWEGRGGLYDDFAKDFDSSDLNSLAEATQQIYLGLPSWLVWAQSKSSIRSKKLSKNLS